jgi:hypothetical protein
MTDAGDGGMAPGSRADAAGSVGKCGGRLPPLESKLSQ